MNELDLIDALVLRLDRLFYGWTLLDKNGVSKYVKVFAQYIPQAEGLTIYTSDREPGALNNYAGEDFANNFPSVIVKAVDRVDSEERGIEMCRLNMKILCCVYDESSVSTGYRDVLNMLAKIREDILTERFIDNRFHIEMPLKSKLIEADSWPVYFGEIELKCEAGRALAGNEYVYGRRLNDGRRSNADWHEEH
ncbi:MAG: hypothetical protein IJP97_05125 [Synergistaceae bacterium]|nr:hypothetical protein [Synergistaceae bacterium]MBR0069858.1 hypothetical protein [Synergistaceae bacterium]